MLRTKQDFEECLMAIISPLKAYYTPGKAGIKLGHTEAVYPESIYLYLNVGEETRLIARVSSRSTSRAGDTIKVAFDMSRLHIFDKDTERCIVH